MLVMSTESQDYKIEQFVSEFSDEKYFVDKNFQRNLVWDTTKKQEYIQSLIDGRASSGIISGCIRTAKSASESVGDVNGVVTVSKQLKLGKEYISLDGMQRRSTILDFYNSKLSLDVIIRDHDNTPYKCRGKLFKDFPPTVQMKFKGCTVHTNKHKNMPYREFWKTFHSLNSGDNLNEQEKRTAIPTPISKRIRNLAEDTYSDVWSKISTLDSPNKIKRMFDSQTIVDFLLSLMSSCDGWNISHPNRDRLYKCGMNKSEGSVPQYQDLNEACEIIKQTMFVIESFPSKEFNGMKVPLKTMWATLFAIEHAFKNNLEIIDYEDFVTHVKKVDDDLEKQSRVQQGADIQKYETQRAEGTITEDDFNNLTANDKYYWRWINRNTDHRLRGKRKVELIRSIEFGEVTISSMYDRESEAA